MTFWKISYHSQWLSRFSFIRYRLFNIEWVFRWWRWFLKMLLADPCLWVCFLMISIWIMLFCWWDFLKNILNLLVLLILPLSLFSITNHFGTHHFFNKLFFFLALNDSLFQYTFKLFFGFRCHVLTCAFLCNASSQGWLRF